MFLETLLLTLIVVTPSHQTPPWISLFENSDEHCLNTTALQDTYTAFTDDTCKVFPSGGNMGDPTASRIGGYWGALTNITAYKTPDCWEEADQAWHMYKDIDKDLKDESVDGQFCRLLSDVSPGDPEPFFAGVKGIGPGSGLDLSSLDINHIPPIA